MKRAILPVFFVAVVMTLAGLAGAEQQPLGAHERAAIARVRALATLRDFLPWRDFDPMAYPTVIFARGEWALAFGFDAPLPGFAPLPDVTIGGRAVLRDASGSFAPPPWSPASVGGRWTVIAEEIPPAAAPSGMHLGGPSSEESMARMVGDAFGLYLMSKRGTMTPHAPTPVGYPDSAELIALASLEKRILLDLFQIRALTEITIPDHKRLARQAIAVHEERARLLGPDLAAAEEAVELWDGLRSDAATVLHKLAMQSSFRAEGLAGEDPSFNGRTVSGLHRALALSFPMSLSPDGPAATVAQIAARACALGFAAERLDGAWRLRAVGGDRSLTDILSATLGEPGEGEVTAAAELLSQARQTFHYDVLLEAGRETIERVATVREAFLAEMGGGGARVVIRLNGAAVSEYLEDAASARHLGGGSLLHERGLLVRAAGLELDYLPPLSGAGSAVKVVTRSSHRSDRVAEIVLVTPAASGRSLFKQGTPADGPPLILEGEGLAVRIVGGRVSPGAEGETIVDLPVAAARQP